MNYTIEVREHGVLIYGSLPFTHVLPLFKAFRRICKVDIIDCCGIAQKYGANICLARKKSHDLWMTELGIKP